MQNPSNDMSDLLSKAISAHRSGDLASAKGFYSRILAEDPSHLESLLLLGSIHHQEGHLEQAIPLLERVQTLKPDHAGALPLLGRCYDLLAQSFQDQGRLDEAEDNYKKALQLNSNEILALNNLGNIYTQRGRLSEAEDFFRKVLAVNPDHPEAHNNLGSLLKDQGRLDESLCEIQEAIRIRPDYPDAHHNFLMILNYQPNRTPEEVFRAHEKWGRQVTSGREKNPVRTHTLDPERRLKIGYVSADLREHSCAYFMESLLKGHDHKKFEIFAYAEVAVPDGKTGYFKTLTDQWRSISGMSASEASSRIREDGFDVLVDLSGHTSGNRLDIFALKPVPLQVTYLGYPATTGLTTIDYRFTDIWSDPEGLDGYFTEKLCRLPQGFLCFTPQVDVDAISPLPALKSGRVTLVSFNHLAKTTPEVVSVWAEILKKLPSSRLTLKNKSLEDSGTRQRYLALFKEHHVDADRLQFSGWASLRRDHLNLYGEVDLALDPFPYNGTTTTCEALWMGVPVLTLRGGSHAGLVGTSLMTRLGLPQFIAESKEDYVSKAVHLARDLNGLAGLRMTLRERMKNSNLCDYKGFASSVEAAYRDIWRRFVGQTRAGKINL